MRYLFTLLFAALSLNTVGQVDGWELPWNPDADGDGVIAVSDLTSFLTVFGSEFQSLSTAINIDSTYLAVEIGSVLAWKCEGACKSLGPMFEIVSVSNAGVFPDFVQGAWVKTESHGSGMDFYGSIQYGEFRKVNINGDASSNQSDLQLKCVCITQERPKVEYSLCNATGNESNIDVFIECCQSKVQQGWYPLCSNPSNSGAYNFVKSQAFWRWAE